MEGAPIPINAHFEGYAANGERRRSVRRSLKLGVGAAGLVTIRDMSLTGMLIESSVAMLVGTTFDVELPHANAVHAVVVWNSGEFYGCEFHQPIPPAVLSAARLQSAPEGGTVPVRGDPVAELRKLTNQVERIAFDLDRIINRLDDK